MNKSLVCLAALMLALGEVRQADADLATIRFFTSRVEFEAGLISSTTIDFETIGGNPVGDTDFLSQGSSTVIDDVTFSEVPGTNKLYVAGKNAQYLGFPISGTPFESAILLSASSNPIKADLSSAGSDFTAVGGFFGDTNSGASTTTLTLRSPTGTILDT